MRFGYRLAYLFRRVDAEYPVGDGPAFFDQVPMTQVMRWAEYFECEPAGPHIDDAQHARLAGILMNMFRGEKTKPVSPEELLMGDYGDKKPHRQSPEEVQNLLLGWANAQVRKQKARTKP